MDGGAWWATVHGVSKSRTRLSDFTCPCPYCHPVWQEVKAMEDMFHPEINGMFWFVLIVVGICLIVYLFTKNKK